MISDMITDQTCSDTIKLDLKVQTWPEEDRQTGVNKPVSNLWQD
jgi:hypothetical protein